MPPDGILNLNKTPGITSRGVVDRVQRLARPAKVGHAGTLDPLATGVLVVCVGAATRLAEHVQRMPKQYAGTFLLGRHSPTEDVDGEITELTDPPVPSLDQLKTAAAALTGRISQRPPAFSALKVAGRRAYSMARRGEQVELKPRTVEVHRLAVVSYDYPEFKLDVECGSGTYIRSLGRDLAESLGTAAVMSNLERTAIGGFTVDEAIDPETLTPDTWTAHLRPLLEAVAPLERIELTASEIAKIRQGQTISHRVAHPADGENDGDPKEFAAVDSSNRLIAILAPRGPGTLRPVRNFPDETTSDAGK